MFGIKPKTLHYWYKKHLSGYEQAIAEGRWGEKKIQVVDADTGEIVKEKPVPIAKAENVGADMTIDEKQVGKKMYTIMTNQRSGKIALLAQSLKSKELKQTIENYFVDNLTDVRSVSCDMSASYKKLCKEIFPNAGIVIDKFHVLKHVLDALQQVRKHIKTNNINEARIQVSPLALEDQDQEKEWTDVELLERSRYVLCKMDDQWEEEEKQMMDYLFNKYPLLKQAYDLTVKLRLWYDRQHIGSDMDLRERDLYDWCDDALQSKIPAFRAVRKMIEKHHDDIINYFKQGHTNARAENMNGKIQRFLANNFGVRDRDFFLYRLAGYFS
jgi:transposase